MLLCPGPVEKMDYKNVRMFANGGMKVDIKTLNFGAQEAGSDGETSSYNLKDVVVAFGNDH